MEVSGRVGEEGRLICVLQMMMLLLAVFSLQVPLEK